MHAPSSLAQLVRAEPSGFGAVIAHPDFDALVAQPGFADGLVALLAKHLVIRIDAPPYQAKSLGAIAARLGPASVNKGPRLAGFEHIIHFNTPASRMPIRNAIATLRKSCIMTRPASPSRRHSRS